MGKAENTVESYLHGEVVKLGGTTRKWVSPQYDSVPDRLIFLPFGRLWVLEVKTLKKSPSKAQYREINRLALLGYRAGWVQGKVGVNEWLEIAFDANIMTFNGRS